MGQILKLVQHTLLKNVFILFCIIANSAAPGPYLRVKGKTETLEDPTRNKPFLPWLLLAAGCTDTLSVSLSLSSYLSLFLFLSNSLSISVSLFLSP